MSSPFRFKQFSISQEYSPMKVGTDSVLLGAWTPAINPTYILDIGAGTGVLSLMMAQRFPLSHIHAVELHPLSAKECRLNVSLSPWHQAVEVFEMDIRDFASTSATAYDLIIIYFTTLLVISWQLTLFNLMFEAINMHWFLRFLYLHFCL